MWLVRKEGLRLLEHRDGRIVTIAALESHEGSKAMRGVGDATQNGWMRPLISDN